MATAAQSLLKATHDQTEIHKILMLLREFQKIDPEFPLQYAICLLQVAREEGISLTDLSSRTGMALSTISRIIGALSNLRQMGRSYELIEVRICAAERRRKELYLSEAGQRLVGEVVRISSIL